MYLEIDEGFDSHPKTVRLCRVLGDVNAGQYLIRLWTWACRSAPDGDLSGMEAADVEAIAKYKRADGKLFSALTESWSPKFGPWIDVDDQGTRLHNWTRRTGASIKKMADEAEGKKLFRAHKAGKCDRQSCKWCRTVQGQSEDGRRTVGGTSDTDQTRPDQTRPDQSGSDLNSKDLCPPAGPGGPVELDLDFSDGQGAPEEPTEADMVRAVFAHYRGKHPRAFANPQPGTKEWRLIVARLKEGSTVDDLCAAIDGYHLSPHHQGHNDRGTKYLGLELMVRDGTHVLQGLEFKAHPPQLRHSFARTGVEVRPARRPQQAPAVGPKTSPEERGWSRPKEPAAAAVAGLVDNLAKAKGAVA
jgi:hypothetical protein